MVFFQAEFVTTLNGVETVETVVLQYADSISCQQEEAAVNASEAAATAARAQCTTVAPSPPSGKVVRDRNCGGSTGDQIIVIGDDSNYVRDQTGGGGTDPGTSVEYDTPGELLGHVSA